MRLKMKWYDARGEVVCGAAGWAIRQKTIAIHGAWERFLLLHDQTYRDVSFVHGIGIQFHLDMIWINLSKVDLHFKVPGWI